jgi:hypothetical protein
VESDEQPQNRRARRAAQKAGPAGTNAGSQDRNQRVRTEAARQNPRGAGRGRVGAQGLDAGEKVDDVFLRGTDAAGKFFNRYATWIQAAVVLGAASGMGYLIWNYRSDADEAKAGDRLGAALDTESARLAADTSPRTTQFGLTDTRPEFADQAAKNQAALEKWRSLENGTPAEIAEFARLSEAGLLYDAREFTKAREKYESLDSSKVPIIAARATEGVVLSLEGEGKIDSALTALGALRDLPGQADLASYHEARLTYAQGNRTQALETLQKLKTKLSKGVGPFDSRPYLLGAVEDLEKTLNPRPEGPGSGLSPETLELLKKQLEQMQQQGAPADGSPAPFEIPSGSPEAPLDSPDAPLGPLAPTEEPAAP